MQRRLPATRRLGVLWLSIAVFQAVAEPLPPLKIAPLTIPPPTPDVQVSTGAAFEDRSASRLYRYDTVAPTSVMTSSYGEELVGIHGFDAVGGEDTITSISCMWANANNGATSRIYIWQADSTGNIRTAVPLLVQNVTVRNANTGIYNRYPLSTPVRVTGRFYVGYSGIEVGSGPLPLVPVQTDPPPPGRAWTGFAREDATQITAIALALDPLRYCYPLRAHGLSGAFTYQGKLTDNGSNFTGVADVTFTVYDSLTGGSTRSPGLQVLGVPVNAGLFTAEVPGDPDWFTDAADAYLEIQVKPAGSGDYTALTPRQRITSTPAALYATHATSADSAAVADSATTATTASVAQSVAWSGVTGVPASVSGAFSPWTAATGGIAYAGGRVGIGTSVPASALHLSTGGVGTGWQLQLTNAAAAPNFETGMRMSDSGFFEITNRINGFTKVARLDSSGAWTAASDARLKTDLSPFGDALDAALRLRPVRFKWIGDGMADFGVIAQELRSVLPEAVSGDESKDSLTVNYSKLSVVAIGAIQEQQAQIKVLREQNDTKQREIEDLKSRLERLERAVERVRPVATRP
ncbi:MAG: tail fiber domain-containing protein [Phycisphaerales bacterium]|nr:tail fiber domain-containing protein [Phycisphaerales bacterium]